MAHSPNWRRLKRLGGQKAGVDCGLRTALLLHVQKVEIEYKKPTVLHRPHATCSTLQQLWRPRVEMIRGDSFCKNFPQLDCPVCLAAGARSAVDYGGIASNLNRCESLQGNFPRTSPLSTGGRGVEISTGLGRVTARGLTRRFFMPPASEYFSPNQTIKLRRPHRGAGGGQKSQDLRTGPHGRPA
jgi:hypothetical protein